jgi:hypothetical protein
MAGHDKGGSRFLPRHTFPLHIAILLATTGGVATRATAQAVEEDSQRFRSVLDLPMEEYEPRRIQLGGLTLAPELEVDGGYDSNIYAAPVNKTSDAVVVVQPRLAYDLGSGERWSISGEAFGALRRYVSTPTENSNSYGATTVLTYRTGATGSLSASGGYRRAVESRSDPEARRDPAAGPRLFDVLNGDLVYQVTGGHFDLVARGGVEKYNFISTVDNLRDFTSYRGALRALYRLSPRVSLFVQGYYNRRNFRVFDVADGVNRDSHTIGGLFGAQIDPGGKLRGELGVGMFRYYAEDPQLRDFSGLAINGNIVFTPRDRTAITLDVFRGDVATFLSGASGRIDTRARLGIQQEVRHNLVASAGIRWWRTAYRGLPISRKTTYGADGELEYRFDRHLSIALLGRYAKRTSANAPDEFERFNVGLALRTRF